MLGKASRELFSSAMAAGGLASLAVASVILGCGFERSPHLIHLEYPLSSAEVSGKEIYVEVAPNADAESLLPKDLFGGLSPGGTELEARKLLGPPDEIVPDSARNRDTVYRYNHDKASIEVVRYVNESQGVTTIRWLLRACPVVGLLEIHLYAGIVDLIEQQPQAQSLVVLRKEGTPLFEVEIEQGRISCIYWYPLEKVLPN